MSIKLTIKILHAKLRLKREEMTPIIGKVLICSLLWFWLISGAWENLTSKRVIEISVASADVVSSVSPQGNESTATEASKLSSSAIEVEYQGREATQTPEAENIPAMIAKSFTEDPTTAVAVAWGESRIYNYAHVNNARANGNYKGECSVGIFQVNLAEDGCKGKWVHASKIPGNTIEEKIEWLKIPANNIWYAHELYKQGNTFTHWSAFLNGSYKNYLAMK